MGEIADMGAGAPTISRLASISALVSRASAAISTGNWPSSRSAWPERIGGEAFGDAPQRQQAEAHLQRGRQQQRRRQRREGRADDAVEAQHLVVDLGGVAGDGDAVAAVVAEIDVALDDAQPLLLRALGVALPHAAAALAGLRRQARQIGSHSEREECTPSRCRAASTCQYQPDSGSSNKRLADRLREFSVPSSGEATSATSVRR